VRKSLKYFYHSDYKWFGMKEHKAYKNEGVVTGKVKNNCVIYSSLCFTELEFTA
jgi:hypothetical protein